MSSQLYAYDTGIPGLNVLEKQTLSLKIILLDHDGLVALPSNSQAIYRKVYFLTTDVNYLDFGVDPDLTLRKTEPLRTELWK